MSYRPRQYIVTHLATGEQTVVLGRQHVGHRLTSDPEHAARKIGFRYPADCEVHLVPAGQEYELPFDELPLVIRQAEVPALVAPAA